jgi:hypothetical protein
MSAPSSVPCAEPMPYSDDVSEYAEIDFNVAPSAMQVLQASLVPVDSILSKQLGPVSNPVQSVSTTASVVGSPILPSVGENNAKPLLSSYVGADVSAPMTLSTASPQNVLVNNVTNSPTASAPQPLLAGPPEVKPFNEKQQFTNVNNFKQPQKRLPVNQPKEQFVNKNKNLANYINDKQRTEHFSNPKVEHFNFKQITLMDNIVIGIVLIAFVYYVVTLKHGDNHVDLSKIPILAQLSDKDVSVENKIIIVVAVVIACVLISRMMK